MQGSEKILILLLYSSLLQNFSFGLSTTTEYYKMYDNTSSSDIDPEEIQIPTKFQGSAKEVKYQILQQIFGGGYDKSERPPGTNGTGPVVVTISLYLRSIENINDVNMEYIVQLTYRQAWHDPRISFFQFRKDVDYIQLLKSRRIWIPDVFFQNEKKGTLHKLMTPNSFTRIYKTGQVLQSYRITLKLSCPMDLRYYPLDKQHCPIKLGSYGWTKDNLIFEWQNEQRVQLAANFNLARFTLDRKALTFDENCEVKTSTGAYHCLNMYITFHRDFGFYFIQLYIPCGMLVMVSWVSFWLDPSAVEARVSLGVTTILTVVTQTYGINQTAPPASYVKALDVWTSVCLAMVFASLIQFALVNYVSSSHSTKLRRLVGGDVKDMTEEQISKCCAKKAKRIDLASRIIFPLIFLVFNVIYWFTYLIPSQEIEELLGFEF